MHLALLFSAVISLLLGWAHGRTLGLETPSDGGLPILNLPYARIQAKTYDQENDVRRSSVSLPQ